MFMSRPWYKFYPDKVPPSIEYPEIPLYDLLKNTAKLYSNREAIFYMGERIKYGDLLKKSYQFANALYSLGVRKGDRVALMLPNAPQYVIAYFGTLLVGGIVTQISPMFVERELLFTLNDANAKVLICLDVHYEKVKTILPQTILQHVLITSVKDFLPFLKKILYPFVQQKKEAQTTKITYNDVFMDFYTLQRRSSSAEPVEPPINPKEDVAVLQYTGGTTGTPKGAMLTHYNLVVNAVQSAYWINEKGEKHVKIVGVLPLFHIFGLTTVLNLSALIGGSMLLFPRFEPEILLKTIHHEKPKYFPGAPTMFNAIVHYSNVHKYKLTSLEACISGSAPLPEEVQNRFEKITDSRIIEGYGLTETSPITHANPFKGFRKNGSVGLPFPDTDVVIVDPDTYEPLPVGSVGELAIRGPQVMKGYWNKPEETRKAFIGKWFLTGDIGMIDDDGYFYVIDRKKDMINAAGYNVFPVEIEEVLYMHPAIQEAAVVGVPDAYRGETIKAYIVLKQGLTVKEKQLDAFCRSYLAPYKVPRYYEFVPSLPKTMVGKVLRRELREDAMKKHQEGIPFTDDEYMLADEAIDNIYDVSIEDDSLDAYHQKHQTDIDKKEESDVVQNHVK
ncbi:MAG: long-chain fatty acid--CoA ligase [Candidatus Carbobacillus altaicus]|nr:long-chain fatty acid--CoA ligase [Candidatus Carbobacillus altaicus]